ncbi:hypothetical protein H2200_002807 [Cladophialophora chaetospira]|uniref:Uncharacterized protein n=1 Tax=Cladophialophora chaetospira TaxID=386627 RepID=A0AA38XGE0_9EURO|nr:hypothetical protein H2200_002807 [Cladophialophora chaetospira]
MSLQTTFLAPQIWPASSTYTILASAPSGIPLPFDTASTLSELDIDSDIDMLSETIANDSPTISLSEASSAMETDTDTPMTSPDINNDVSMEEGDIPSIDDVDIEMLPPSIDDEDDDVDEDEVMSEGDTFEEIDAQIFAMMDAFTCIFACITLDDAQGKEVVMSG